MEQISQLLKMNSLGYFQSIELIEIVALIKDKSCPFNLFTLAVAQELPLPEKEIKGSPLTPKLIKLESSKKIKIGIFKSILSIDEFVEKIKLLENNQWSNHNGKPLVCGQLRYIPNVFAPSTDNEKNEYLGLLKNNFFLRITCV